MEITSDLLSFFQDKPLGLEEKLDRILEGARITCSYTVGQVLACIHRKCLSISRSCPTQGQGARTAILVYPQVPEHGASPGYLWARWLYQLSLILWGAVWM